tara:strand:- start:612 stop:905 length:294 start_codon:yes stop_codon:yes gene_type:complete
MTEINEIVKIEEFERYTAKNHFNYTEMELAKRSKAIKDLEKDYSTVPALWLEWLYDIIENKPKEEVEKIINDKLWLPIVNKTRVHGGEIVSGEIVTL